MGKKRGKIYIPTYNEAEQAAMARAAEVADAVRLDDDEEAALGMVSNMMSLVTIFSYKSFKQKFPLISMVLNICN